jgi:hypothetical protein
MLRVFGAGLVGGLVLMIWSVVFSAVGPADGPPPPSASAAATIDALRASVADTRIELPFGPSRAAAAEERPETTQRIAGPMSLDMKALAQSLAVACGAATIAALLMAWFGGERRPFAERVFFAVLLGAFAGLAMNIPAGGWTEFSVARTTAYLGEVLVGWTLAGMVIAVMLNAKPRKAKA